MKVKNVVEIVNENREKKQNNDEEVINKLKKSGKPILIYGCANHAKLVWNYLVEHGLKAEAFIVDSEYYKPKFYINQTEVKDITNYLENINLYNIVIGFCDVEKSRFLINNANLLKGHFYFLWEPFKMYEWDNEYLNINKEKIQVVYDDLADTISKKILIELINAKLNVCGKKLLELSDCKQYFNELTFCPNPSEEVFIDCGAFVGDTILKYVKFTGGVFRKIYAFEPNADNFLKLKKNVSHLSNIKIVNKGTWKETDTLKFEENGSASQIVETGGQGRISVVTIDEVLENNKATFIKMDVEGSELESLQGAVRTITNNMPKLAICCYHKRDDIINLHNYIKSFNNNRREYQFYLRHHSNSVYETVLYAIPIKRKGFI